LFPQVAGDRHSVLACEPQIENQQIDGFVGKYLRHLLAG
jgi:hypothetical protein